MHVFSSIQLNSDLVLKFQQCAWSRHRAIEFIVLYTDIKTYSLEYTHSLQGSLVRVYHRENGIDCVASKIE
jgi:hypothetical protein